MNKLTDNNGRVIIRKAVKSDAKALIDYLNVIGGQSDFLTFGQGEFKKSIKQVEQSIENCIKKNNSLLIIAEINGNIVGNLDFSAGITPRIAHVGEFGVSVLKRYWGKGIGEALIKYLIEYSKKLGIIRKINLRVRIDNMPAIALYKKLGFIQEGIIRRDFFINGKFYDCLVMGLLID